MLTASQIVHRISGAKANPICGPFAEFTCWVCGGQSMRGIVREKWMGANFTGQNRVRCIESRHVCEACVSVMAGRPPDTERMWTHLVEGDKHVRVNKGDKPEMRAFLRRGHSKPWFAAIADSGKKHVIPWAPINPPSFKSGGAVMFEDMLVQVPPTFELVDAMSELLTLGATKEEIERGDFANAWQRCAPELRAFEERHGCHRGSPWFVLAVWLAQRDEERVAARMEKEKADAAERKRQGKAAKPERRSAARNPSGVPQNKRIKPVEALGHDPGPNACVGKDDGKPGGVAVVDVPVAPAGRPQLSLF
jgi:hypothetical protein